MDKLLLSKYSKGIQYAVQKIEDRTKNYHEELKTKLKEAEKKVSEIKKNTAKKRHYQFEIEDYKERLANPTYADFDADVINLLSKFDSSYKTAYLKCSKQDKFYAPSYFLEDPEALINLFELGVDLSPYIEDVEKNVMADGRIHVNTGKCDHVKVLCYV